MSIIRNSNILLSGEVIIDYCENHTKLLCMLGGGQNTEFSSVVQVAHTVHTGL